MGKKGGTGSTLGKWVLLLLILGATSFGCAVFQPEKPKTLTPTDRGTVPMNVFATGALKKQAYR